MTAAMIASNSFCSPRSAAAEPASATCSTAKSAEQSAVTTNRLTLTRATGTPSILRRIRVAADGEDPVAAARAGEHEAADRRQHEPPHDDLGHADGKRAAAVPRGDPAPARHRVEQSGEHVTGEERREQVVARREVAQRNALVVADDRLAGEHRRQRQAQAAQDEIERERDDEARKPGADHQVAVQRAEHRAQREREDCREPTPANPSTARGSRASCRRSRSSSRSTGRTRRRSSAAPRRRR